MDGHGKVNDWQRCPCFLLSKWEGKTKGQGEGLMKIPCSLVIFNFGAKRSYFRLDGGTIKPLNDKRERLPYTVR